MMKKICALGLVIFTLAFTSNAADQWLVANNSTTVSISRFGFWDYYGQKSDLVIQVPNATTIPISFGGYRGDWCTFKFCAAMTSTDTQVKSLLSILEVGISQGKQFLVRVNDSFEIVQLMMAN